MQLFFFSPLYPRRLIFSPLFLQSACSPYTRSPDSLLRHSAPVHSTPTPTIFKNLALNTSSRDSFYSCPDLSTLQISSASAALYGIDNIEQGATTEPDRSPSPESAPRTKKRSKSRAVSRKARGVIGKVRAFQRIATAKMAHPAIKIDTSVPATKRELPDGDAALDVGEQGVPRLEAGNTDNLPPFLCQSVSGE